jgi:hypothetical protein
MHLSSVVKNGETSQSVADAGSRQTAADVQQGRMHVLYWLCVTLARISGGDDALTAPHVVQVLVCASREPPIVTLLATGSR